VDRNENRPGIRESRDAGEHRFHPFLASGNDAADLWKFGCERLELGNAIRCADQNDMIDIWTVIEGGKAMRYERTSAERS
jgi:hypothetical protein